ncbi:MAG TPA: 1-deoxy-D-xylulose-5-phosphate synthase, partial [Flavobacteriaceae bacterium]|nr:1-deoxy-D-xylulose-5-phosphate synthase [Flavobacteriaceae bacterium]
VKVLHVKTIKGKGLAKAEENQVTYHAPGKFDKISGELIKTEENQSVKYQDVFGFTLLELAKHNKKIIGITPAMPTGSSLKYMMAEFPNRAFDVGIAEQHAVTLAAGIATQGLIPFCVIYSTFLQRAYDQIIHDVALQKLPVIFCVDRAGLVGEDGATHHGVFDIAFLRLIPNLIIASPLNASEFQNLLYTAQLGLNSPIAIRYPRGLSNIPFSVFNSNIKCFNNIKIGKGKQLSFGNKIAILSIGTIGNSIVEICKEEKYNSKIAHFNMLFVKPLDERILHEVCLKFTNIITVEDGVISGGFGSSIIEFIQENNYQNIQVKRLGIPDNFIEHGTIAELHLLVGLDICSIKKEIDKI